MQTDRPKESLQESHISDTDSDPDWNEQLISAVRQKEGRSKKITEQNRLDRIQDCLNEGADINAVDKVGNTVLHIAVKRGWKKITQFLLHNGAKTDIYNRYGQTAIALSATIDKREYVNDSGASSEHSISANEFISADHSQPSTSRGDVLQFRRDLSPRMMSDKRKFDSNQRLQILKRNSATDGGLDKSPKKVRMALDSDRLIGLSERLRSDGNDERITQVPIFDNKKTYAASGLKRSLHGTVYQLKHLMLILHRAWKLGYPFRLSTEMIAAEKFDDLVLQYRDHMGKEVHRFGQVKHKQDDFKEIRASDLLTQSDGDFSLQKYFISWRKIRKHSEFTGSDSMCFILLTNIGIDLKGLGKSGIDCRLETQHDEFLKIPNRTEQSPRYKLFANENSELHNILKATSDVCKLARIFAQRVHTDKDIDLKTSIFKYYHTALAEEIIDIQNKTFFSNFIKNIGLSGRAENFRAIFFSNMKQLSKRDATDQDIWKIVEECSLKLSKNFGKECEEEQLYSKAELPDDEILNVEISDFFKEFVLAVNQPNEIELGEMIANEIGADSQFNILNGDFIGDSFQKVMLDWFKQKGENGTFLTNKHAEDFFNAMELRVSSLVTVGLNLAYPEELEKYGIRYQDENSELLRFVTCDNVTEIQILNLIAPKETLLTALRVYQTLLKIEKFKKDDSFIFVPLKTLLLTGIMNRVIHAFESPHGHHLLLIDCGSITENMISQELWNPLCNIVRRYSDKRIVLITQANNDIATQFKIGIKTYHERDEDVSFNNLTKHSQHELLGKLSINFQGQRKMTSFGRLLGIHSSDNIRTEILENLEGIINTSMLVSLIRDEEIRIGGNLKGLGEVEDYYINRTIVRRVVIKEDILQAQDITDLFAISDIHEIRSLADLLPNQKVSEIKFTILDKDHEEEQFELLCKKNSKCNVHWLHGESDKLIWKQSLGDISNLVKYRDAISTNDKDYISGFDGITEDRLAAHDKHPKIVIISDTAGMGKSTVLTRFAGIIKKTKSDLLVVSIDLTDCTTMLAEEQNNPSFERENTSKAVDFLVEKILNIEAGAEANVFKRIIEGHGNAVLFFDGFDEISPNYEDIVIDLLQTFSKLPIKKLFITTRPHTRQILERKLNAFSYTLQPFSTANQIEFLAKFWKKRLDSNRCNMNEERLQKYAKAVIKMLANSVDDWMNEFTGVALQTRMVAEVFGEFYEYEELLESKNDETKLPEKIDLIDLYRRFIDKKYYIYCTEKRKDDPTNPGVGEDAEDLREIFLKRHQKLALCTLFNKEKLKELLPSQQDINFDALIGKLNNGKERTGIVTQIINNKPYFIHRTFAEYFTATFLISIIKKSERYEPVGKFFISEILLKLEYKTIRAFLNCLLLTEGEALGNESWKPILIKYCNARMQTALHVAAAEGNCGIITFLLNCLREYPADRWTLLSIKNNDKRTAVYAAAENRHWGAFRLLTQHEDADVNCSIDVGKRPLQMAVCTGNLDLVKFLIDKGADVNSRDNFGFTPIDEGVMGGFLDIVEYLVTKGAEINCSSNSGFTPVHWASRSKNLHVLKYLVERGGNVNSQDSFGKTPIHQPCLHGDLDVIKYLLEAGANVNLPDMFGTTPLQCAANSSNWDVVRYLLTNGANSDCLDEHSLTVLHETGI